MDSATQSNEVVLKRLQELSQGLYFLSESDYPFEVAQLDKDALSEEDVRNMAGQPQDAELKTVELAYFLRNMTKVTSEMDDAAKQVAERFSALQAYMEEHLIGTKVYRVGRREVEALVLGRLPEGGYGGIKTIVVET